MSTETKCRKVRKLGRTRSSGPGSVQSDLYIIRIGIQSVLGGISVYLPMCIGEVKTKFLIDTGSEVTIMPQKLFERIPENVRPKMVKTACNVTLEVADKGLVQVAGVADISFFAGSQMYTWHVLIAPIEEEGLLSIDFLFAHNFELSMKGLLLNGQKVTTETEGVGLDSVRVSVKDDV